MSINLINIGNVVNDGLGDDLRTAFEKVNANFADLQAQVGANGFNVGAGVGVFKNRVGGNLNFKSLLVDEVNSGLRIIERPDVLEFENTRPQGFTKFETQGISIFSSEYVEVLFTGRPLEESPDIEVQGDGSKLVIDTKKISEKSFTEILTGFDFGPITGEYTNAVQFAVSLSNADFGTVEDPSSINLDFGGVV